jgi:hypothetical protein
MPRSGTTVLFELVARHPELAWISNYVDWAPGVPAVHLLCRLLDNRWLALRGRKQPWRGLRPGNRLRPQPVEGYAFWERHCGPRFTAGTADRADADEVTRHKVKAAVARLCRLQGTTRFVAKLTGPGRIGFLTGVFPDARFVHLVRDGREVVRSLLEVEFWARGGGLAQPFWPGCLTPTSVQHWQASGRDPAVLAALQWVDVNRSIAAQLEAIDDTRSLRVRYEDLVDDPGAVLARVWHLAELPWSDRLLQRAVAAADVRTLTDRWSTMDARVLRSLTEVMAETLAELGYPVDRAPVNG